FALSFELLPSTIGLLSMLIGFILSISAPAFIVFKYAANNNHRVNIVLPVLIYYAIVLTVNLAFFWAIFATFFNNLFYSIILYSGGQRACICHCILINH